jgi:hypothetical protein
MYWRERLARVLKHVSRSTVEISMAYSGMHTFDRADEKFAAIKKEIENAADSINRVNTLLMDEIRSRPDTVWVPVGTFPDGEKK